MALQYNTLTVSLPMNPSLLEAQHTQLYNTCTCTVPVIIKVTLRYCTTIVALRYGFWFHLVLASSNTKAADR